MSIVNSPQIICCQQINTSKMVFPEAFGFHPNNPAPVVLQRLPWPMMNQLLHFTPVLLITCGNHSRQNSIRNQILLRKT